MKITLVNDRKGKEEYLCSAIFLYDARIPSIREYLRHKLEYLCLHGFSGPFGPKWRFWEGVAK